MAKQAKDVSRNTPCPCGSGRKFKQCCASKSTRMTTGQLLMVVLVGVIFVGGLLLAVTSRQEHTGAASGVWSEEHGHYH